MVMKKLITGQQVSVRRPWPEEPTNTTANRLPGPVPGAAARGDLLTGERVKGLDVDIAAEHRRHA